MNRTGSARPLVVVALLIALAGAVIGMRVVSAGEEQTSRPSGKETSGTVKQNQEDLKQRLTPMQYKVTQQCGTEPPFANEFWNNKHAGIYVDVVTGEPLFSSREKFDSGTGWPSFWKPLESSHVVEKSDVSHGMVRTEVVSKEGGSHLGHLFDDGPNPTGLRYCINSASLRFIPVEELEAQGYGQYVALFQGEPGAAGAGSGGKSAATRETAVLAGGCFWGVEELIRELPGVIETEVGYAGGSLENPTYGKVKHGDTGHAEAVQIVFDPSKISYETLLGHFFRLHDPTTLNRQGNDVGTQYRSSIFYYSEEQRATAQKVKDSVETSGKWKKKITTEIVPAATFYPAEDYHQDYLQKNPGGYTCHYWRD